MTAARSFALTGVLAFWLHSAGWSDRGGDFAVVGYHVHRQELAIGVAHNIDRDIHRLRERLGLAVGFILGHELAPGSARLKSKPTPLRYSAGNAGCPRCWVV